MSYCKTAQSGAEIEQAKGETGPLHAGVVRCMTIRNCVSPNIVAEQSQKVSELEFIVQHGSPAKGC